MLKARILSALVMVPLVIASIFYLSTPMFALCTALVVAAGFWEWSRFIPLENMYFRWVYLLAGCASLGLAWFIGLDACIGFLLMVSFSWWLWVLVWFARPGLFAADSRFTHWYKGIAGLLVLVPAWAALVTLHANEKTGPGIVLLLLAMIWAADIGAYFSGKRWGKTRLAPDISPGKTWQGVYGGIIASLLVASLVGVQLFEETNAMLLFILAAAVAMGFSVVGDLLESLMKRQCGLKDSGQIIPGHGGVLDRIDSVTAAAPVFLLGSRWMGIF